MNETEIARIAAATNALRPDWPIPSIITLLGRPELANRPRRDVAVALTWVACESDTKTPARVISAGPWWNAAAVEGGSAQPRTPWEEMCITCSRTEQQCELAQRNGKDHEFMSRLLHRRLTTRAEDDKR